MNQNAPHDSNLSLPPGLVDVGETWQCPAQLQEEELHKLEQAAVLTGLQEKHLTYLTNPRWLKEPISMRGGRDLWSAEIEVELLPNEPQPSLLSL